MTRRKRTYTETFRRNPWILSTLLLGLAVLFLLLSSSVTLQREKAMLDPPEDLCLKTQGVPAWFDWKGNLIETGYKPIALQGKNTSEGIVEYFIDGKVTFVYSSTCGYCAKQIEWFGEEQWKQYQESGLTIDCAK